jgi:hypothetical protein
MFLRDNLQTSKVNECESMVKHIQSLRSQLKQLSITQIVVANDDVILSLMKSMPLSYKTFMTSMKR